jgi:hypothetical protein
VLVFQKFFRKGFLQRFRDGAGNADHAVLSLVGTSQQVGYSDP